MVVLTGDITLPRLGLSDHDIDIIVNEVSVIFHSAATVRFDEDLSKYGLHKSVLFKNSFSMVLMFLQIRCHEH